MIKVHARRHKRSAKKHNNSVPASFRFSLSEQFNDKQQHPFSHILWFLKNNKTTICGLQYDHLHCLPLRLRPSKGNMFSHVRLCVDCLYCICLYPLSILHFSSSLLFTPSWWVINVWLCVFLQRSRGEKGKTGRSPSSLTLVVAHGH